MTVNLREALTSPKTTYGRSDTGIKLALMVFTYQSPWSRRQACYVDLPRYLTPSASIIRSKTGLPRPAMLISALFVHDQTTNKNPAKTDSF